MKGKVLPLKLQNGRACTILLNNSEPWGMHKRFRNKVNTMTRKAKPSYNRKIIEENSDNPKNFWKAVKKVVPKKKIRSQLIQDLLVVEGNKMTDTNYC